MSTQHKECSTGATIIPMPAFLGHRRSILLVDCRRGNGHNAPGEVLRLHALPDKAEGLIDEHFDPFPEVLPA